LFQQPFRIVEATCAAMLLDLLVNLREGHELPRAAAIACLRHRRSL